MTYQSQQSPCETCTRVQNRKSSYRESCQCGDWERWMMREWDLTRMSVLAKIGADATPRKVFRYGREKK